MVMMRKSDAQLKELEAIFYAVSDPDNARYGQHLSSEALTALVGASDEQLASVQGWLAGYTIAATQVAVMKDMIEVTMDCTVAETMLQTTLYRFQHTGSRGLVLMRASSAYSLPQSIATHVSMVGDLVTLPEPRRTKLVATTDDATAASKAPPGGKFPAELTCQNKCGWWPRLLASRASQGPLVGLLRPPSAACWHTGSGLFGYHARTHSHMAAVARVSTYSLLAMCICHR